MRFKPSFSLVSLVMTILCVMAVAVVWLRPGIPPPPPNRLGVEGASFLQQGAHEGLHWRPLTESAFAEARRLDMPILMLIGGSWSEIGRRFDRDIFTDASVQNYINREFICVRIDADERPDWMTAFLPASRVRTPFWPGFQIWFLDSRGRVVDFMERDASTITVDAPTFLSSIIAERRRVNERASTDIQYADHDLIGQRYVMPLPSDYATAIQPLVDPVYGGFPSAGAQRLHPEAWRLLLMLGLTDACARSLRPILLSPLHDLTEGGFFRAARSLNFRNVETDKVTVENAAMLRLLCSFSRVDNDVLWRWSAMRAFDALSTTLDEHGLMPSGTPGQTTTFGRNPRLSFGPIELSDAIKDDGLRAWAQTQLRLSPGVNPQALPALRDEKVLTDERTDLEKVLALLSKAMPAQVVDADAYLDVNGFAIARMTEAARWMGWTDRANVAASMIDRLNVFLSGDDVAHGLTGRSRSFAYIGDYLAYADAMLQDYLATGRQVSFDSGARVLSRGLFLFKGSEIGEYLTVQRQSARSAFDVSESPEIVDTLRESTTAQIMRLCMDYGRIVGGKDGAALVAVARDVASRYGEIAAAQSAEIGGYFCALVSVLDQRFAVAVGPNAVSQAALLAGRCPSRLVVPAVGAVRLDLQKRPHGIYIVAGTLVTGPLALDAASSALNKAQP